jgi:tetratricopeptide (TPR) repeat protein
MTAIDAEFLLNLVKAGEHQRAYTISRMKLCTDPTGTEYRQFIGNLMAGAGEIKSALRQFRMALTQEFDSAQSHLNFTQALKANERHGEALRHVKIATVICPSYEAAISELSNFLSHDLEPDKAVTNFWRLTVICRENASLLARISVNLAIRKTWRSAIDAAAYSCLSQDMSVPDLRIMIGHGLFDVSEDRRALELFRRAAIAHPSDLTRLRGLVHGYSEAKQTQDTVRWLTRLSVIQSTNSEIRIDLARALFWDGRFAESIAVLTTDKLYDQSEASRLLFRRAAKWSSETSVKDPNNRPRLSSVEPTDLVFFIRDDASLDHSVPIIHTWTESLMCSVLIILMENGAESEDPRLRQLLNRPGKVQIVWLNQIWPASAGGVDDFMRHIVPPGHRSAICFDHVDSEFSQIIASAARRRAIACIAFPHGEIPYINLLTSADHIALEPSSRANFDHFDTVLTSSDLYVQKYTPRDSEKYLTMGSSRYNSRWLAVLDNIVPAFSTTSLDGLRIALFLPKAGKQVFWEELVASVKTILLLDGLNLVISHHPRKILSESTVRDTDGGVSNVLSERESVPFPGTLNDAMHGVGTTSKIIYGDVLSTSLVRWADVCISLGTSITFEAVVRGKPVIELSYCHGNYSTIAKFLPETDHRSRDHLIGTLRKILHQTNSSTKEPLDSYYDEADRNCFISELIDGGGPDVLAAYSAFLRRLVNGFE